MQRFNAALSTCLLFGLMFLMAVGLVASIGPPVQAQPGDAGVSKREAIAAQVFAAAFGNRDIEQLHGDTLKQMAQTSVKCADLLLAALRERPGQARFVPDPIHHGPPLATMPPELPACDRFGIPFELLGGAG